MSCTSLKLSKMDKFCALLEACSVLHALTLALYFYWSIFFLFLLVNYVHSKKCASWPCFKEIARIIVMLAIKIF